MYWGNFEFVEYILKRDLSTFLIQNYDNNTALHEAAVNLSSRMCLHLMSFVTDEIWKQWEPQGHKKKTRNIFFY